MSKSHIVIARIYILIRKKVITKFKFLKPLLYIANSINYVGIKNLNGLSIITEIDILFVNIG